ncbi:MAG: DMT family transporter [Candidatus Gottesmanbacteria bacterium]|nr:DMT family transporter [Candidatus Gottesmanbacteria bacterium]
MSSRMKALIAIILASLLWSTAGLSKIVVRELDPYVAAFLRFFVASIVILPFFLKSNVKKKHIIRDLVPLSLLATANILFYYLGLSVSTANAATLIYAGVPMLVAILAHQLIGERLNAQKIAGIILGLIGVLFIALLPVITKGESITGNIQGNLFFLLAALVWALYTVGSRNSIAAKGYSPLTVTSVFMFTACIVFAFISVFTFQSRYIGIIAQPSIILLVLHLGTLVTVFTYLLFQWAVKHSSATTASLQHYIGPIFSILVNVTVLKETVTPAFLVGTALVLIGVVIANGSGLLQEVKDWVSR